MEKSSLWGHYANSVSQWSMCSLGMDEGPSSQAIMDNYQNLSPTWIKWWGSPDGLVTHSWGELYLTRFGWTIPVS